MDRQDLKGNGSLPLWLVEEENANADDQRKCGPKKAVARQVEEFGGFNCIGQSRRSIVRVLPLPESPISVDQRKQKEQRGCGERECSPNWPVYSPPPPSADQFPESD